jgi:hypothetical protein
MAKFTVTGAAWNKYSGQISRVPPAISTRHAALAMIFMIDWKGLLYMSRQSRKFLFPAK